MVTTRQEQILRTAASLFAERGFHGVSVHDIGAACGISGPALYRHFAGKDAILSDMLVGISQTLQSGGRARLASAGDPKAALDSLVAFHIDFALTNPALIVVQEREWTNLDTASRATVRALQLDYVDAWVEVLRALRPELDQRTARAAVQATFGLLNSTPHSARISEDAMAELLTQMARRALLG
ncbi:SACE_7040 family transcriptional regulator [Mumia quercus]|uniref:SACE_7040 family transcriptional regulator n=1 Tax=Mumia quercus TaxID=2976125 RepID=UPI0021D16F9B|nr:TetR/AcrR family transcriptional regulator [Mumia quercus]